MRCESPSYPFRSRLLFDSRDWELHGIETNDRRPQSDREGWGGLRALRSRIEKRQSSAPCWGRTIGRLHREIASTCPVAYCDPKRTWPPQIHGRLLRARSNEPPQITRTDLLQQQQHQPWLSSVILLHSPGFRTRGIPRALTSQGRKIDSEGLS